MHAAYRLGTPSTIIHPVSVVGTTARIDHFVAMSEALANADIIASAIQGLVSRFRQNERELIVPEHGYFEGRPDKPLRRQLCGLLPFQDRLRDFGCEKSQAEHARDVGPVEVARRGRYRQFRLPHHERSCPTTRGRERVP
jgi:hypothetical protein